MEHDRALRSADVRRETGLSQYCTAKFLSKYGFVHNHQLCIMESYFRKLVEGGFVDEFKANLRKVRK